MAKYILAHDIGTSSVKSTLFSLENLPRQHAVMLYPSIYSNDTWCEQDPDAWWEAIKATTAMLLKTASADEICAVVCSGHMMGCLLVDEKGRPLHNAIIWSDMRATEEQLELERKISISDYHRITGHRPAACYTLSRLMWMKKHFKDIYAHTHRILLTKDYIVFRMTGRFVTDHSDASGTAAYDLRKGCWADEIIELAEIRRELFPEIHSATEIVGEISASVAAELGLAQGTPVVLGGGDGRCASIGTGNIAKGAGHICLGTSAWVQMTVDEPITDAECRLTNWAHIVPGHYVTSGPTQCAGSSLRWLKELLFDESLTPPRHGSL